MNNGLFERLSNVVNAAKNSMYPGRCLRCELPSHRSIDLCQGCEDDLPLLGPQCSQCAEPLPTNAICAHCLKSPPDFTTLYAPYIYEAPITGWLNRFKQGDLRAGAVLGRLLAQHIANNDKQLGTPDRIIAMPLHWKRQFQRGFNQSHELAILVANINGFALDNKLVKRAKHTPHQQSLNRQHRLKNLRSAFQVIAPCNGLHLVVIDDVVTTASTARAIATALKSSGAASVQIWAVARTSLEN